MYRLLKIKGKGPIKSIPHISNNSTSKMVCKGDSSRYDMLPILWYLSQVDTGVHLQIRWANRIPIEVPLQLFYFPQIVPHMLECGNNLRYFPFPPLGHIFLSPDQHNAYIGWLLPVVVLQLCKISLLLLITKLLWEHSCHQVVHKFCKPRYWIFVFNRQELFIREIIIDLNFFTLPFPS